MSLKNELQSILDTLESYEDIFSFVKNETTTRSIITQSINTNTMVLGTFILYNLKFIDYIILKLKINCTVINIFEIVSILKNRFGNDVEKEITNIDVDIIYKYFNNCVLSPIYSVFLENYVKNNIKNQYIKECNICYDNKPLVYFLPCKHSCCILCHAELKRTLYRCHICRNFIITANLLNKPIIWTKD